MKTSDWDDPEIRAIGRRYAAEAYDLASELHNYGADAAALLKPHDPMRPRDICLPAMRLCGPNGAKDEFLLAATAQNLRKLAKLIPVPAQILAA